MPGRQLRRYIIAILVAAILISGCSRTRVVLWTDRADAAPVVELFNHDQDKYVVELRYDPDVASALRLESTDADIVIARSIADRETASLFHSLDRLLRSRIDPEEFYSALLENGAHNGRHRLLPLSFNLPLVFFVNDDIAGDTSITLSPDEMRAAGTDFSSVNDGVAERLSFSPLWDSSFLYELVRSAGFRVREAADGEPEWELSDLLAGLAIAEQWIESDNGGLDVDAAFRDQYLYDPVIRLVQRGRIQFGFDESEHYFKRSDASKHGLDYRWMGMPDAINVLESIVYAGIPVSSRNHAGANAFVTWLFSEDTQARILTGNRTKRVDSFGILGGFSSLWRVTERSIPREYPDLAARIPPASWLRFPGPSPRHWEDAIEPVVQAWMTREVSGQPQDRDLRAAVEAWLLQQGE